MSVTRTDRTTAVLMVSNSKLRVYYEVGDAVATMDSGDGESALSIPVDAVADVIAALQAFVADVGR